jgi:organic radical activating enzyme
MLNLEAGMNFKKNCCDGIYRSYDIHFTKYCDNKCSFCVDKNAITVNSGRPDWEKMANAVINNCKNFDDVLILGGEPCLFLDELYLFVTCLKEKTHLKVYVTTSMPKTCYDNKEKFYRILEKLDGLNISVQHDIEEIADKVRGCKATYDRQTFYKGLPHRGKIRLNLNIVKGYLDTKEDIIRCIKYYDELGFNSFKFSEIQHSTIDYISFEKIFGIKLPSPYYGGCQTLIDTDKLFGIKIRTPLLLKRSCFVCENTLKASFFDGLKVVYKILNKRPLIDNTHFGVVYEDGTIKKAWIKEAV